MSISSVKVLNATSCLLYITQSIIIVCLILVYISSLELVSYQDPRPELDRFSPIASLDKKNVVKRSTKSSQRLDCLSYYLMFYDRNTIFSFHKIASRDEQS